MSWLEASSLYGSNDNKGVKEMTFDARRTKWGVISFYKHNTNYIVSNVSFSLELQIDEKELLGFSDYKVQSLRPFLYAFKLPFDDHLVHSANV